MNMEHFVAKIHSAKIITHPFFHMYIEDFFPIELYTDIKNKIFAEKNNNKFSQTRTQDNPKYINSKFSIFNNANYKIVYDIFDHPEIKNGLLHKFYNGIDHDIFKNIHIHHNEFEFVHTNAGCFQNIHIDVPFKLLSMVMYFPENEQLTPLQELQNATILYNKNMQPIYSAKYKPNSLVVFAPHYYSYHGFNTTIERMGLVCFYKNDEWNVDNNNNDKIKTAIYSKIKKTKLIEYDECEEKIQREWRECKINAPMGRVIKL